MMLTMLAAAAATFQSVPCKVEDMSATFERDQHVECGWVDVPRDSVSGKTIRLWTARARATGARARSDPILYINGGPGVATVDPILSGLPRVQSSIAARFLAHPDVAADVSCIAGREPQQFADKGIDELIEPEP